MMKFKEIRNYLQKENISYYESENGQHLFLKACAFDDKNHSNFFDYGEPFKEPCCYTKNKVLKELYNDPRIIIMDCSECCGCAGW